MAAPSGVVLDNVLNGDSCTTQPDNPSIKSTCQAVGFFADAGVVAGLQESSVNGQWGSNAFGSNDRVTDPVAVSCVPQQADIPSCLAVGEQFNNPKFPQQLVAPGTANGFFSVTSRNPKGTTWSVLSDVSCATLKFCLLVGEAGTIRKTRHGLLYIGHSTAYTWNGSALHLLATRPPPGARQSELAGVSCPSATICLAVGNYLTTTGRSLPYSALWSPGGWRVRAAINVNGRGPALFQAVSCPAVGNCVAVGYLSETNFTTFAERYAHGAWTLLHPSTGRQTAFYSVSCPAPAYCVAVGRHASKPLIEAWTGSRWTWQAFPAISGSLSDEALGHVSCVTAAICTAVGYRHNPKVRFSFQTLALGWNGKHWTFEKSINQ